MAVTQLTFRKATASDAGATAKLVRSAYRGEESRAGWTTEADYVADERIDAEGVLAKISQPDGAILLAHDDAGKLAACCEVAKKGDVGYFGLFAVDPQRQAGGIGKQVLARAEDTARELGVRNMEMWVIWMRESLISFYERRGYTRTDRTAPFPYHALVGGAALRDDLYFVVLEKAL